MENVISKKYNKRKMRLLNACIYGKDKHKAMLAIKLKEREIEKNRDFHERLYNTNLNDIPIEIVKKWIIEIGGLDALAPVNSN